LAGSGTLIWICLPVFALMGLFGPSVQSLMSRRVGISEQGQLQGATSSIMGITGMIGPGLFTLTSRSSSTPDATGICPARLFFWQRCCS